MFQVVDDWVTNAAKDRPEHPALETSTGVLTYAGLDEEADLAAARLADRGVGPGARVATTLPPGLDFAVLLHALPRIGAALVPLNTRLRAQERDRQRELAGAELIVDAPLSDPASGVANSAAPSGSLDPAAVHTVVFTSGTAGEPRPVELTLTNHEASAAGSAAAIGADPADRWLCPLPLFHVGGLAILLRCARAGTTAVVHERFDAARVATELARGSITLASLVPTMLARLREVGLERAPALRALLLGGGPLAPELLEWARERKLPVRGTYGMTETCSHVVVSAPEGETGPPVTGARIAIDRGESNRDEVGGGHDTLGGDRGQRDGGAGDGGAGDGGAGDGGAGEILVGGAMVARGALAADGWLHTGDAGRLDERGHLYVEGRIKELIISGGENVAPARVEAALLAHPAVREAGVVGVEHVEWGEAVVALVVLEGPPVGRAPGTPEPDQLREWCRSRLGGHEVPKRIEVVAALPRNAAGKLVRHELAALAARR
jgi:O-succinylbenzoic acid--CoA ligase